ncbi:24937_t:CDS:2, partial [Gigaspora rosea]
MVEQIRSKERDQFGKVKKWNNLTNKVRLQHFKKNMESGQLTQCKVDWSASGRINTWGRIKRQEISCQSDCPRRCIMLPKEMITERLCNTLQDIEDYHPNKKVDQNKTNSEQIMGIEKKILITALLLIITIARYKSVIKINTNCSELVRIIEQDAEIKGCMRESCTKSKLG